MKYWNFRSYFAFGKGGALWKTFTGPAIALLSVRVFVEVGTACAPIQAVTTRWHHGSGNKVQRNPKAKAILPGLEGLLQTRSTGWICDPMNWSQGSPKCKLSFEQNGLSSRWQGGIYDLGWKPSEHLTCNQADLVHGYAWRTCVYLKQNPRARYRSLQGTFALETKPEGLCPTLHRTAVRRFHVKPNGSGHELQNSNQTWSAVAPLHF